MRYMSECAMRELLLSRYLFSGKITYDIRVGNVSLPQVKEFKYLGVLLTSEGIMGREIDRRVGAGCDEKGVEPEGKALDLLVNLRPYPHLCS